MAILEVIRRRLQLFVVAAIALGLANVYFFGGWQTPRNLLVAVVVGLVIYPVMINMNFVEVVAHLREPRPVFCSLFINFVLSPMIGFILGRIFLSGHPELFAALLLVALIPTSAMSTAWTAFSGARVATALYLIPANLLFAAFVGLPFFFPFLSGDSVQVDQLGILRNLALVFFLPLVAGNFTRALLVRRVGKEAFAERIKPQLGNVSAAGTLVLLVLAMSLPRNAMLFQNIGLLWRIVLPLVLYYGLLYALSWLWANMLVKRRVLPPEKAIVIVYTSVTRHINITLAVIVSTFPMASAGLMVLLVIVAYVIQVPTMAVFAQRIGTSFVRADTSG